MHKLVLASIQLGTVIIYIENVGTIQDGEGNIGGSTQPHTEIAETKTRGAFGGRGR
jgi:hypothetical protein